MRKQEFDNWIENGGELPQNLTEDEKSYLKGLGWYVLQDKWSENGQKWYELHFLHGKKYGKHSGWHHNGHRWYEEHYLNGKKHGRQESWFDNGQKYIEVNYHHEKLHGVWKTWTKDGTLEEHKEYAYGILLKDYFKEET